MKPSKEALQKAGEIVDKNFPFDTYRKHQRETIIETMIAFLTGTENVVYEGVVGSGKSVVGVTLANILKSCFYITAQKLLMSQLTDDFGDRMAVLKGRNAYPCWYLNDYQKSKKFFNASNGTCVQRDKSILDICKNDCRCDYANALNRALIEPQNIFNFSSFLYQREMANRFTDQKKLLIVDEAHAAESQIMNFVDVVIGGKDIDAKLPEFKNVDKYVMYFDQINLLDTLATKILNSKEDLRSLVGGDDDEVDLTGLDPEDAEHAKGLLKDIEKYGSVRRKYLGLKKYVDKIECISDFDRKNNAVSIKPLYASYHAPTLLLAGGEKRLFMSGTILNYKIFGNNIGLDLDKTKFIKVPHTFPVHNRLVYLDYAGSMNYKNKNDTIPKMIKKINKLMDQHKGEKGIIHCQSFWLMDTIVDGVSRKNKSRLLCQKQKRFKSKEEMLEKHMSSNDTVIIAPAMHEGLNLKDSASRFQIICKIPYPSTKENKQLEKRVDLDWNYYLWLTSLKFLQSLGRSIRSETDYASTYIIDSSFDKFFNMADRANLMPDWFVESLVVK